MLYLRDIFRGTTSGNPGSCLPCTQPQACAADNVRKEILGFTLGVTLGNSLYSAVSCEFVGQRAGRYGDTIACDGQTTTYIAFGAGRSFSWTVDVWRALADGAWSSSAQILVRANLLFPYGPTQDDYTLTVQAFPIGSAPLVQTRSGNIPYTPVNACPISLIETVTVFDDGTFTITP